MSPLLETQGLTVDIGGHRVCEQLALRIHPGQCWALLGRNGTGKTTLLQHLAGLRHDHAGNIRCAGRDLKRYSARERALQIGILLQHSSRGFGASVFDTVSPGNARCPVSNS